MSQLRVDVGGGYSGQVNSGHSIDDDTSSVVPDVLPGGTVGGAVKVGSTVRRPTGPWTPAVHALLHHLQNVGFSGAPRVLGTDSDQREILSYVPGVAALRPWPTELRTPDGLREFVAMVREYHRAVAGFVPPAGAQWRIGKVPLSAGQVIRHGDLGPWNTIWRAPVPRAAQHLVSLIDFDFAEPGAALADVAQLAWYAIPLRPDRSWREAGYAGFAPSTARSRLDLVCEVYGGIEPAAVIDQLSWLQQEELRRIQEWGRQGRHPWATFLARGDAQDIADEAAWLAKNFRRLSE